MQEESSSSRQKTISLFEQSQKTFKIVRSDEAVDLCEWSADFSIGINRFDNEHKQLFALINDLNRVLVEKDRQLALEVFQGLIDYTVYHFHNEEKIFHRYKYPETKMHIELHRQFVSTVASMPLLEIRNLTESKR